MRYAVLIIFVVVTLTQGDKQPLKKLAVGGGKCNGDDGCHKVRSLTTVGLTRMSVNLSHVRQIVQIGQTE